MPVYCFRDPEGKLHELVMSRAELAKRLDENECIQAWWMFTARGTEIYLDKPTFTRGRAKRVTLRHDIVAEQRGFRDTCGSGWPRESQSMACHPRQVKMAMEGSRIYGCPTDYTPAGKPVLRSPQHQKDFAKMMSRVTERPIRDLTSFG